MSVPRTDFASNLVSLAATYLPASEVRKIMLAYSYGEKAHEGQFRRSGEPYISHPVAVATILATVRADHQSIVAALLHDIIEDTGISRKGIESEFGEEIASLVDGVSKIQFTYGRAEEANAANLRKMIVSLGRDVRTVVIALAERLHNLRTLDIIPREKRIRIARETLHIHAPLADRFSIRSFYNELTDLSFREIYPRRHFTLARLVDEIDLRLAPTSTRAQARIRDTMHDSSLPCEVIPEKKQLFEIYSLAKSKRQSLFSAAEFSSLRVLVGNIKDCYGALGVLHSLYRPVPNRFADSIAAPRLNGQQFIHAEVIDPDSALLKVTIQTDEMYSYEESGVTSRCFRVDHENAVDMVDRAQSLARQLISDDTSDMEFQESLRLELYPEEVLVFTPRGDILSLPLGATPVDFAYSIDSQLGNTCVSARVDGQVAPLRTRLQSGQTVEIITSPGASPNPHWLHFTVTSRAKKIIQQYLNRNGAVNTTVESYVQKEAEDAPGGSEDPEKQLIRSTSRTALMELAAKFFHSAGFTEDAALSPGVSVVHHRADKRTIIFAAAPAASFDDAANVPQLVTRHDVRRYRATCLYVVYDERSTNPDAAALAAIRNTIECDVVPLSAAMLASTIRQDLNCSEALRQRESLYLTRTDPYYDSNPIRDPAWFFGRTALLDDLTALLSKGRHIAILGSRKIGKTSLINQLDQRLSSSPHAVIDCQGVGTAAEHIFAAISQSLLKSARSLGVVLRGKSAPTPDSSGFSRLVSEVSGRWSDMGYTSPVLVMFDEIDKLFRDRLAIGAEESLLEFVKVFRSIRALAQSDRCLVCLVAAYRPDVNRQNLLSPRLGENPMFQAFEETYLGNFSKGESDRMIRNLGRWKDIRWEPAALSSLFEYCGGHPLVSRYFASKVTNKGKLKEIDSSMAERVANEVIDSFRTNDIGSYYKEGIWSHLREGEQQVLRQLASDADLRYVRDENCDSEEDLANLKHFGLVVTSGEHVQINGRLFRSWLTTRTQLVR